MTVIRNVFFDEYRSFDDFSLILTSHTIGSADAKTETVNIDGADGVLDLTEYFGDINFKNRTLSFEFSSIIESKYFVELYSAVQNYFNGRRMRILIDNDPYYYYMGRVSVDDWKSNKAVGKISIKVDAEPYKYKINKTIITYDVVGEKTLIYPNDRMKVVPSITLSTAMQVTWKDIQFNLSQGTQRVPEIEFEFGQNTMTFKGTGKVTVEYQEGSL